MTVQEAIKWLKAISVTLEMNDFHKSSLLERKEALHMGIQSMREAEQYRALGTVEELKEAMEKQVAKKVISWQGKKYLCPFCHRAIKRTEALDVHCKYCGQALKWEEEDD